MKYLTEKDQRSLTILHLAMVVGCSIIAAVIYFLMLDRPKNMEIDMFVMIGLVMAAICLGMHRFMYHKLMDQIKDEKDNAKKTELYRGAHIMQWALLEGAALMNICFFFLEGSMIALLVALTLLFVLFIRRPMFL